MFSNLTLYYLNQLGITPWISKEHCSNPSPVEQLVFKLCVITPENLNNKAQLLFKRIVNYINVSEEELLVIHFTEHDAIRKQHLLTQMKERALSAVLMLGIDDQLFSDSPINCPVVSTYGLDQLISNPITKKLVFRKISYIKALIHSNQEVV